MTLPLTFTSLVQLISKINFFQLESFYIQIRSSSLQSSSCKCIAMIASSCKADFVQHIYFNCGSEQSKSKFRLNLDRLKANRTVMISITCYRPPRFETIHFSCFRPFSLTLVNPRFGLLSLQSLDSIRLMTVHFGLQSDLKISIIETKNKFKNETALQHFICNWKFINTVI